MTLTSTINSSSGVNVNYGATNYLDTITDAFDPATGRFGYFNVPYVNGTWTNASQYGIAGTDIDADGVYDDGTAFLAGGNMSYSQGLLSGTVDTLAFGSAGITGITPGGYGYTTTSMSLASTDFTLTSLGLSGSTMNDVLYGLMNGDEAPLEAWLASNAVIFNGGNGADAYQGGTQVDQLNGGSGNDTLAGGGGADALNGGAGQDIFVFAAISDSAVGAGDTISDFNATNGANHDTIDLSALDVFAYNGTTAAANSAWYSSGKISVDSTGDGVADLEVTIGTVTGVNAADFHFAIA
jgi:Ca2+-binding RTX toxin-like protein